MSAQTATVIVTAPLPSVFGYLSDPDHLRSLLSSILATDAAADWAFSAEPSAHRVRWQLLAPFPAHGTLAAYGDCSISQLWLEILVEPDGRPPARLRTMMHTALHRIREQIEADASIGGQPAMSRPA